MFVFVARGKPKKPREKTRGALKRTDKRITVFTLEASSPYTGCTLEANSPYTVFTLKANSPFTVFTLKANSPFTVFALGD